MKNGWCPENREYLAKRMKTEDSNVPGMHPRDNIEDDEAFCCCGSKGVKSDFIVKNKAKISNRYNQVPHLTQDTAWKSDNITTNVTNRRAKKSALSQQVATRLHNTDKTIWQRQIQLKISTKKFRIGTKTSWTRSINNI